MAEYLIVVDPRQGGGLDAFRDSVLQEASDRLAVVRLDDAMVTTLRARPDVVAVVDRDLPEEVVRDLDAGERLFAAAWAQHDVPKRRIGEGLSWDTPGFSPPDA